MNSFWGGPSFSLSPNKVRASLRMAHDVTLGGFSMGVLLPHVGRAWASQHSELHENQFEDDLINNFKDDLKIMPRVVWHFFEQIRNISP